MRFQQASGIGISRKGAGEKRTIPHPSSFSQERKADERNSVEAKTRYRALASFPLDLLSWFCDQVAAGAETWGPSAVSRPARHENERRAREDLFSAARAQALVLRRKTRRASKVVGFARTAQWAEGLPVYTTEHMGLVHFLQRQFRYHLRQYIFEQMRQLEAQPDVLQLEHRAFAGDDDESFYSTFLGSAALPHAQGGLSAKGLTWAADRELEKRSFDLPAMDLEWVRHTEDKLFRNMSRFQRHLLYLV